MAKKSRPVAEPQQPVPTRWAFLATVAIIVAAFAAELIMAAVAYGRLPATIDSGWFGWAPPGGSAPSWLIFIAFPGVQVILFLIAWFSPKDEKGRRVMDTGRAISLVLLALLFAVLQSSVFRLVGSNTR
ncbi:MAG: hypothetical protein ACYC2Y_06630 [Armatimonadota bacterium]